MDLKLHQLRALVGVVEHGGIRAAARAMHLTQAALTKSLRQLEEDAGVPLIVRSPRGVTLTPAGERLHARAYLVSRQMDLACVELERDAEARQARVRASVTPFVIARGLADAYRWFRKRHANVGLGVVEGLAVTALPGLRSGAIDLALLVDYRDLPADEFDSRLVTTVPQTIVVRQGHPVLAAPTAGAVAQLEWLLLGPRESLKEERFREIFTRAGAEPPQRLMECDALAAFSLLRSTDVAAIMPSPLLGTPEAAGIVPVEVRGLPLPYLRLMLLTRPDVPLTPAAAFLVDCLVQAVTGRPLEAL